MLEYAPAPESRDIVDIRPSYELFINGEWVAPQGEPHYHKTVNPADEEVLAEVAWAGEADVNRAVAAAREAFTTWSARPGAERAKYLFRIARIIQERSRELAVLESLDNGKPIRESRDVDLPLVAAHFFYYAGWADKLSYAGFGPEPRPLGVAAQVIPWNFPLLMLAWKIAPALACGNTVVLKPAETTPLTALTFAGICRQADLPPGVVNIVTGAGETGAALVSHPGVAKVAFTGSTEVGRLIARNAAGTGKKVTLELGGKAANIVFEDAAIDQAVEGVVNGIFFNQGHVCCAGSRLPQARPAPRLQRGLDRRPGPYPHDGIPGDQDRLASHRRLTGTTTAPLSVRPVTMTVMTTNDPLAPFQWLNTPESQGGGPLGVIFSVAFFRGLDPAEVVRRFSLGQNAGEESDFGTLDEKVYEFVEETDGGLGGGHVGVFRAGEWCVAIEPFGWWVTDDEVVTRLSRGCEVLAVTRHDYAAEHSFEYAIDGTTVMGYRLRHPYERHGADPDRLNGYMRELGMGLDKPEDDAAWDAAWDDNYDTAVPRGFALAARVTGVPLTRDLLDRPMLVGPIAFAEL